MGGEGRDEAREVAEGAEFMTLGGKAEKKEGKEGGKG